MIFDTFHRHRLCLVGRVDLTGSLCSWWEGFGSSSLATLPLGFTCGFISTSACGSSTGICSWGCPGGLGFAPVRARCGGGAGAWVAGVLAAPGTQGAWRLGQQEIGCSRRVWQTVLANTLQYSCLENPPPWQRSLAGHSLQRVRHYWSDPARIDARLFFFCRFWDARLFWPVAALSQRELSLKVAQLLGLWGSWRRQVRRDTDCLCRRSHGTIRVCFLASCSWWSESLFGQPLSAVPPVQALGGLPCLGSFSVLQCIRYIEGAPLTGVLLQRLACQALNGAPWVGSYSVVQRISHLKGHPGWSPTL